MIIDFHTHTFFSDGALSPAEQIRRAVVAGYKGIGLTDHADFSNMEHVFNSVSKMASRVKETGWEIDAIAGLELTHVPAALLGECIAKARDMGTKLVIVHGESVVEPVEAGTNREAILGGADILAHPGLISDEDAALAAERGVYLEITSRKGHSLSNGWVLQQAKRFGAKLVLNSDAHIHTDFLTKDFRTKILMGCGMSVQDVMLLDQNMEALLRKIKNAD